MSFLKGVRREVLCPNYMKPMFSIPGNDKKNGYSLQMSSQSPRTHMGVINLYPDVPVIAKTTVSRIKPTVKATKKRLRSETPKLMNIGLLK